MDIPFSKQFEAIKAELKKDLEIGMLRQGLTWRLSRLKDLDLTSTEAYAAAQKTLGL